MKVGFDWPVGRLLGRDRPLEARQPLLQVARERGGIDLGGLVRKRAHAR